MDDGTPGADPGHPPAWRSHMAYRIPDWVETVLIITILLTSMLLTRRRDVSILGPDRPSSERYTPLPTHDDGSTPRASSSSHPGSGRSDSAPSSPPSSPSCSYPSTFSGRSSRSSRRSGGSRRGGGAANDDNDTVAGGWTTRRKVKTRRVCGLFNIRTPATSRFAGHVHSRILRKFPFLVEMFYWAITFGFYRLTAVAADAWYSKGEEGGSGGSGGGSGGGGAIDSGLWEASQAHGVFLLELEAALMGVPDGRTGTARWVEWRLQQWFLAGAENGDWRGAWLSVLDRSYALIHIPGTVGFIAYYYATAPSFSRFALVRRALSLLNLFAFSVFILWPCMPPRLLPPEYGFVDTVNGEDAESVWMAGKYVNKLAAMPSMHFGYAFCIGCVFVYESGVLQALVAACRPACKAVAGWTCAGRHTTTAAEGRNSSSSSSSSRAGRLVAAIWPAWAWDARKRRRGHMPFLGGDGAGSDPEAEAAGRAEELDSEGDGTHLGRRNGGNQSPTTRPIDNDDEDVAGPSDVDAASSSALASSHRRTHRKPRTHHAASPPPRRIRPSNVAQFAFGVFYPSWILLTIVATANHYVADAAVAAVGVAVAFACNRVLLNLLPLEDCLLWVLRLAKPEPTTGLARRRDKWRRWREAAAAGAGRGA